MRSYAFAAALVGTALAAPQAVTSAVAPKESTPAGCKTSYDGTFQLVVSTVKSKRDITQRDSTPLEVTLKDGVMTDAKGRTGYIASNQQFQFDGPAQAGAIYTSGWSVCANSSIALGDSTIFYQCLSGTFYNLYDENNAQQCNAVYINAYGTSATATGTMPEVSTVVCQIGDGQVQQKTCVTTATPAVITQIGDGQIQAPTGAVITQISDGQPQAPVVTSSPVVQAPTGATVTQITDGQIQAPTGAVVSQISDGQIQAPTNGSSVAYSSPTVTAAGSSAAASGSASASAFTGAAAFPTLKAELFGLAAAGAMAVFAL